MRTLTPGPSQAQPGFGHGHGRIPGRHHPGRTARALTQARRCYARPGIAEAAKSAGAKVPFVNEYRLKKMALKGEWLKEWEVFTDFVETDKLINVPIAKHHSLSRLTIGMKNWLGAIRGARHQPQQKIAGGVGDLAAFFHAHTT